MSDEPPKVDGRNEAAIKMELLRRAEAIQHAPLGRWVEGFLEIAARIQHEVVQRLDETPEKAQRNFFDWLGMRGRGRRPARLALVFQRAIRAGVLVLNRGVRVQANPPTDTGPFEPGTESNGERSLVFETERDLTVLPGHLTALIAVDGDKISEPPPGLFDPTSSRPLTSGQNESHKLKEAAARGSLVLQLTQAQTLKPGDHLDIAGVEHRVAAVSGDIITLTHMVDQDLERETEIFRVQHFSPFDAVGEHDASAPGRSGVSINGVQSRPSLKVRDWQEHWLYICDNTLLNVKNDAVITISFKGAPPSLSWSYWGTPSDDGQQPRWYDLEAVPSNESIKLTKANRAAVDFCDLSGTQLRVLRAKQTPASAEAVKLSELKLSVSAPIASDIESTVDFEVVANVASVQSQKNFFPLGQEPRLFDAFYLGSAEAFSKPEADITLEFDVANAALGPLVSASVHGDKNVVHAFGVGGDDRIYHIECTENASGKMPGIKVRPLALPQGRSGTREAYFDAKTPLAVVASGSSDVIVAARAGNQYYWQRMENGKPTAWIGFGDTPSEDGPHQLVLYCRGGDWGAILRVGSCAYHSSEQSNEWKQVDGAEEGVRELVPIYDESANTINVACITINGAVLEYSSKGHWEHDANKFVDVDVDGGISVSKGTRLILVSCGKPAQKIAASIFDNKIHIIIKGAPELSHKYYYVLLDDGKWQLGNGQGVAALMCEGPSQSKDRYLFLPIYYPAEGGAREGSIHLYGLSGQVEIKCALKQNLLSKEYPHICGWCGGLVALHPRADNSLDVASFLAYEELSGNSLANESKYEVGESRNIIRMVPNGMIEIIDQEGPKCLKVERNIDAKFWYEEVGGEGPFNHIIGIFDSEVGILKEGSFLLINGLKAKIVEANYFDTAADAVEWCSNKIVSAAQAVTEKVAKIYGSFVEYFGGRKVSDNAPMAAERKVAGLFYVEMLEGRVPDSGDCIVNLLKEVDGGELSSFINNSLFKKNDVIGSRGISYRVIDVNSAEKGYLVAKLDRAWGKVGDFAESILFKQEIQVITEKQQDYKVTNNPELSWEYWNGTSWWGLPLEDGTGNFLASGCVKFRLPSELRPVEVIGKTNYWIRARLVSGDYGREQFRMLTLETQTSGGKQIEQTLRHNADAIAAPRVRRLSVRYQTKPCLPQQVLTYDNLTWRDQSDANHVPAASLEVFQRFSDLADQVPSRTGRGLYIGASAPFQGGSVRLFWDLDDLPEEESRVPIVAEVSRNGQFSPVNCDDETNGLSESGIMTLAIGSPSTPNALFGARALHWIRIRPAIASDSPNWRPVIRGLYLNAVWASAAETQGAEVLGSSVGEPGQVFWLTLTPLIELRDEVDMVLRVKEPLSKDEFRALNQNDPEAVLLDPAGLSRGYWVKWSQVADPLECAADERVFSIDAESGKVCFGDARNGRVPPPGADNVAAWRYRRGGGAAANAVRHASALQLISPVEGIDGVFSVTDAAGGADAQSIEAALQQAPAILWRRGRLVTLRDIEALAMQFSPHIVQARCQLQQDRAGLIDLVVVTDAPHRGPSAAMRRELKAYLLSHANENLKQPGRMSVRGPILTPCEIALGLFTEQGAERSSLQLDLEKRLRALLDPKYHRQPAGGSRTRGSGWLLGAWPAAADVAGAITGLPGLLSISTIDIRDPSKAAALPARLDFDQLPILAPDGVKVTWE
ncbi:MAG TPA: hypothetical protein DCL48_11265 [Alphaproteobacteria bacterium]|nr:hypothetical protein [Alphaproteobacteria bacterium]